MEVNVLAEHGYEEAKYGFSLSYKPSDREPDNWWEPGKSRHFDTVVAANASREGGHNKFLEHIMLWVDIQASLEWWKQCDTYRIGVSKQSESTMHTLKEYSITIDDMDFSQGERDSMQGSLLEDTVESYLNIISMAPERIKSKLLPQGFKQRREVLLSYKVLRGIYKQRKGHRLPDWDYFLDSMLKQVQYPFFITD